MNKKKALLLTIALVLAAIVLFLNRPGGGRPLPGSAHSVYYYDLNTGVCLSPTRA